MAGGPVFVVLFLLPVEIQTFVRSSSSQEFFYCYERTCLPGACCFEACLFFVVFFFTFYDIADGTEWKRVNISAWRQFRRRSCHNPPHPPHRHPLTISCRHVKLTLCTGFRRDLSRCIGCQGSPFRPVLGGGEQVLHGTTVHSYSPAISSVISLVTCLYYLWQPGKIL